MDYLINMVSKGCKNANYTDFFIKKGYSKETISKYRLGYLPGGLCDYARDIDEKKEVLACYKYIIPEINQEDEIVYCISRYDENEMRAKLSFDIDKHFYIAASDRGIWNKKAFYQENPIFICETWTDALSVIDCGFEAISLNRIVNIVEVWKVLKILRCKKKFVLFGDNDYYGKQANDNLSRMLKSESHLFTIVEDFPKDIKDANEWFLYDRESFEDMLRRKSNELL